MANPRLPWILFAMLLVFASFSWRADYHALPDRVASHFDTNGDPNGWMTKDHFLALNVALVGLAALVGLLPPFLVAKVPPALINLPNKAYWLAPERHAETVSFFVLWFGWFACALLIFVARIMYLVFLANVSSTFRLPGRQFIFDLVGFLVLTAVFVIAMIRKFSRTGS